MSFATAEQTLSQLPEVRGRYTTNEPLAQSTWFRVGGPAEVMFKPADEEDLVKFLRNCPYDIPVMILGVASNTIIRDGGIPGVVIRLGREFATMYADGDTLTIGMVTRVRCTA